MTAHLLRAPRRRRRFAFTLIEMIAVVVVLSVLAAFAVPTFDRVRTESRANVAERVLGGVANDAFALAAFNGGAVTFAGISAAASELADNGGQSWGAVEQTTQSAYAAAGLTTVSAYSIVDGWGLALAYDGGCALAQMLNGRVLTWHINGDGVCTGSVAEEPGITLPVEEEGGGGTTAPTITAPAALTITGVTYGNRVLTLTWSKNETTTKPVDSIDIFLNATKVASVARTATSYQFTGLTAGTSYTLKASAVNTEGSTPATTTATAITIPAAPVNLASTILSSTSVKLDWDSVSSTASAPVTGYRIYSYSITTGLTEPIATVSSSTGTLTGLPEGQEQTYSVAAYGTAGEGERSSEITVTPISTPAAVTNLVADAETSSITLSWDAVTSSSFAPVTGYRIYQYSAVTLLYEPLATTANSTYTVTGLSPDTPVSFQVAAYGPAGEGSRTGISSSTYTATVVSNPNRLGLVNYLGTKAGSISFASPSTAGSLTVTQSSALGGTAVAANSVDQAVSDFHTNADGATWATYDFGTANKVFLSGYSIRQRTGSSDNNLRNWVIRGSNDASNWQTLHTGTTGAGQAVWHDHSLATPDTFGYRYLRLQMAGPSSSGGGFLAYSEIEFYGSILLSPQAPLITSASMVSGSPQITVVPTWGALPTSYAILRNGSEVGSVSASGATPVTWSDSSEPAGVVYYTAKSVNATATSLASAAAYPQVSSMPAPVISHTGNVTIGSKIYFIGGYTGSASNALRSYDMATGTWATLANVPQALWAPFATAHADGSKITVAGGYNGTSTGIGNALVYTVDTNTWQTFAGVGTTVFNSNSGARVGDDLYLFGGYENSVGDFVQSYKFNLNTRTWTRLADLPGGGQMRWSVADGAGGIYVGGGIKSGANLATVYRYDVAANTFTAKANQPFAGRGSSAVLLPNGSLAVMGGTNNALTSFSNRVDVYNPGDNSWTLLTTLPTGVFMSAAGVNNGRIHLIGGYATTVAPNNTANMVSFKY